MYGLRLDNDGGDGLCDTDRSENREFRKSGGAKRSCLGVKRREDGKMIGC